jgi:hypothetical protein
MSDRKPSSQGRLRWCHPQLEAGATTARSRLPKNHGMEIVRASSTADLLAMVPALVGFAPQRSVVCVPFIGKRTAEPVMRVDLPDRRRESDSRNLAGYLIGALSRLRAVDRVAIVVYTDLGFAAERGIPHLDLGRALEKAFRRAGFGIVDSACVGSDGWGSYLERSHQDEGRPLADIAASPFASRTDVVADSRRVANEHAQIPDADDERRSLVASLLARGPKLPIENLDLIDVVEAAMAAKELTPLAAAGMLWVAQTPAARDVMLLQAAYGEEVGVYAFSEQLRMTRIQRETGQSMDEIARRELADPAAREQAMLMSSLMVGTTEHVPEWARLERACEVYRDLASLAPPAAVAPALTCLAWLNWALGRGSAAGELLDRALTDRPDYGLALLLRTWFASGAIPEWLFQRQAASAKPAGLSIRSATVGDRVGGGRSAGSPASEPSASATTRRQ